MGESCVCDLPLQPTLLLAETSTVLHCRYIKPLKGKSGASTLDTTVTSDVLRLVSDRLTWDNTSTIFNFSPAPSSTSAVLFRFHLLRCVFLLPLLHRCRRYVPVGSLSRDCVSTGKTCPLRSGSSFGSHYMGIDPDLDSLVAPIFKTGNNSRNNSKTFLNFTCVGISPGNNA